jgi:hypothetical protein
VAGTQPTPRFNASMVYDTARNKIILFGGVDETIGRLNDIWEMDGSTYAWTDKTPSGTKPTPRHGAMMVYDSARGKTVLYAGNTGSGVGTAAATGGTYVDELWEWDGTAGTWTKITASTITARSTTRLQPHGLRPGTNKIVLYYYWTTSGRTTRRRGHGPGPTTPTPTKVETAEPPYNNAPGRLRRRTADAGGVRRPGQRRRCGS